MSPLPGLAPGKPMHHSACSGIRNYHWFKAGPKWSGFFLGISPQHICSSQWRSQSYYFREGKVDMSQNSALGGKGAAGEKRKRKETFLKVNNFIQMVFPNVKEVSRESFSCVLFSLLWDCLTPLTAANTRRALSHIAFLCSCSCPLPAMGTIYFSNCKRYAPCASHAVLLSLSPLLPFHLTSAKSQSTSWYPSLTLAFTYIYEPNRGGEACLFSVSPENKETEPAAGVSEAPAYTPPVGFLAKVKVWKTTLPSGNALEPQREPRTCFPPHQTSAVLGFKEMKPLLPICLAAWWAERSPGWWDSWSPLSMQGTGLGLLTSHIAETVSTRRAIPLLGVLWIKKLLSIFEKRGLRHLKSRKRLQETTRFSTVVNHRIIE